VHLLQVIFMANNHIQSTLIIYYIIVIHIKCTAIIYKWYLTSCKFCFIKKFFLTFKIILIEIILIHQHWKNIIFPCYSLSIISPHKTRKILENTRKQSSCNIPVNSLGVYSVKDRTQQFTENVLILRVTRSIIMVGKHSIISK
jgi:hypothetical protein